ncbi:DUF2059 domain-containing protein [Brevundimonas sp. FT23028]|uniref:DUF2059 domain-containing protein n=1 Tax=Brevundimonas sp. FT23028 TaxID=3393748 RepID=UPI003B589038
MRVLVLVAAVFSLCAGPALAQDAARERQLDLAGRYLQLTQGTDATKIMRGYLDEAYGEMDLPDDQRTWLADQFSTIFEEALSIAIGEVRAEVADTFTAAELEAAVGFYETPMGRSIARKNLEAGMALQQAMMPYVLESVTSLSEKFCLRFDCTELGEAAAKSRH